MRIGGDDPLGPDRPPVGDVVLGERASLVDVTHLRRRTAAAPLLAHQPELDAAGLEQLRGRPRVGGAVEGRLAVDEQHRLAADRQVEPLRPVGHVLLLDRNLSQHRLAVGVDQPLDPTLPFRLLVAGLHGQRSHRLDHFDRARSVAIEVAREQRVGTAQLARPALGAVDVVVGDVADVEQPLLHRHDVRVERGRAVVLVPRDLSHRADLAAELVSRGVAAVCGVAPALDKLRAGLAVGAAGLRRAAVAKVISHAQSFLSRLGPGYSPPTTVPSAGFHPDWTSPRIFV